MHYTALHYTLLHYNTRDRFGGFDVVIDHGGGGKALFGTLYSYRRCAVQRPHLVSFCFVLIRFVSYLSLSLPPPPPSLFLLSPSPSLSRARARALSLDRYHRDSAEGHARGFGDEISSVIAQLCLLRRQRHELRIYAHLCACVRVCVRARARAWVYADTVSGANSAFIALAVF